MAHPRRITAIAATLAFAAIAALTQPSAGAKPNKLGRLATTTSTTSATSATSTTAPLAPVGVLFESRYTGGVVPPWQSEQEPSVLGVRQTDRIRVVDSTRGSVLRVELRPYESATGLADGDRFGTANRAEVYARHASPRTTPAAAWPDPVGSTRWYGFDLLVPADFVTDTTGRQWFTLTQWKGLDSGSPPIALEIKNDRLEMAGATGRQSLGALKRGTWERIVVGVHFQPSTSGWVEVYRDGVQALARTSRQTMNTRTVDGQEVVDPSYLKQGIYRTKAWTVTHVLYFGPTTIGLSRSDVL